MKYLKEAEEYLKEALGGNMNISTLKPLAWYKIMAGFVRHLEEENTNLGEASNAVLGEVRADDIRVALLALSRMRDKEEYYRDRISVTEIEGAMRRLQKVSEHFS